MNAAYPLLIMNELTNVEQMGLWPAGEIIFREGESPRGIYIIHSGQADLVFSSRTGHKKPLRNAGPGTILGLSNAVTNAAYDCTATTRNAVRIGYVPLDVFKDLLDKKPALWLAIAEHLSADLGACWTTMKNMGYSATIRS